jgi:hypothetical protein
VGPKTCLNSMEKRKYRKLGMDSSVDRSVAESLYRQRINCVYAGADMAVARGPGREGSHAHVPYPGF